jgi:DNA replication and repair protein RecF
MAFNNIPVRKLGDLMGQLLTVIFSPEDLGLIKSGPAERRKFIDMELCQMSKIYYSTLNDYYKALKQRNNLLRVLKTDRRQMDTVYIWDEQLVLNGGKIQALREVFIKDIARYAADIYLKLSGGNEELTVTYRPNAPNLEEKLKRNLERDIYMGSTTAGVHKDDLAVSVNGLDIRAYGSQGQQRTASLSMKLAEISLIKQKTDKTPVLLLDDVLSELDESRQRFLLSHIRGIQAVITCTGVEDVVRKIGSETKITLYNVAGGNVFKV